MQYLWLFVCFFKYVKYEVNEKHDWKSGKSIKRTQKVLFPYCFFFPGYTCGNGSSGLNICYIMSVIKNLAGGDKMGASWLKIHPLAPPTF